LKKASPFVAGTVAAALFLGSATAEAASQTTTLSNGCRITGANGVYGTPFAATQHVSNCATVQVKLWTTTGYDQKGYTSVPAGSSLSVFVGGNGLYSDHNGTGTSNPTAWGFRLYL
jgi:hypothetical protein